MAKWLREWVIGIGLGLVGPGNAILLFFSLSLVLQNIFGFVGSVASYE